MVSISIILLYLLMLVFFSESVKFQYMKRYCRKQAKIKRFLDKRESPLLIVVLGWPYFKPDQETLATLWYDMNSYKEEVYDSFNFQYYTSLGLVFILTCLVGGYLLLTQ